MSDSNLNLVKTPDEITTDPLTTMLRNGAQALIAKAVETELETLLTAHEHIRLIDGRQAIVRNGYLPERTIQTGIGNVEIKIPKIRDRSEQGIKSILQ